MSGCDDKESYMKAYSILKRRVDLVMIALDHAFTKSNDPIIKDAKEMLAEAMFQSDMHIYRRRIESLEVPREREA